MLMHVALATLLLLSGSALIGAQDTDQSSRQQSARDEEDKNKSRGPLERMVAEILQKNVDDEASGLFSGRPIFDFEHLRFGFVSDNYGGSAIALDTPGIPMVPSIKFNFSVPYPQIGSPAYEVTGVVRHSLSQDPITGKYWWEW